MSRSADDDWSFSAAVPVPSIDPPASGSGSASATGEVEYAYEITAVANDGTESVASPQILITSAVDIASTAGSITLSWSWVANAVSYNIYKATPGYGASPTAADQYGFAGSSYGAQFIDSNIVADFSQVPPLHFNPFARGSITAANVTGSTGTVDIVTLTINTSTGSGAVIAPVIVNGSLNCIVVFDGGSGYAQTDTITVTVTSGGGSATASLVVGPETGTYPSTPAYFQERRVYANSLNNPDTYWMSQPGAPLNFDYRIPTIDSDAITGSPWAVEVNGIQAMVPVPAGLMIFTGLQTWLLVGAGSFATNVQPISPSSQVANPQPNIGCSPTVPPVPIDYDVLFVSSIGSYYYDQPYQLYALSEPIDLTVASAHLFQNFTILGHAWCRNPSKLLWAVRDDGIMLSLTYLKTEQISGWGRHDTFGQFVSNCSVTEPPVDALYVAVDRPLGNGSAYVIERMNNRMWTSAEECWCVDCGFELSQPKLDATLSCNSATGPGSVTGATDIVGGSGYSAATTGTVVDAPLGEGQPIGPGTGAVPTLTFIGGVLTGVTFFAGQQGSGYINPQLVLDDPANIGAGASAVLTLDTSATFTASAAVFDISYVGNVIRSGGGIATITDFIDDQHVTAEITSPIVDLIPGTSLPANQAPGDWTMTAPVTSIYVPQLANTVITGLVDGNVIPPAAVGADGVFELPRAGTAIIVGLGFTAQLQTPYLDVGTPTIQGQRKKISAVTARIEGSRQLTAGSNQPDGSTLSPPQIAPVWQNLDALPDLAPEPYNSNFTPLYTGDARVVVSGGFAKPGQIAFQQSNPVPMNILAVIGEAWTGDVLEQEAKMPEGRR